MLEPVTFIAPLGTWKMDVGKSEFQVEWWWRWGGWWWMMMMIMIMVMMTRHCEGLLREETHQANGESSLWGEGGGGSLSPGRSGIRGPTRPFASQSKTQGSPLGGYLSWLGNVLRATTACNFSSLLWPAGFAPAALASLLFDPPEPQIIGKTLCFATFRTFRAPGSSFFWDFLFLLLFSSLTLLISAFHLSILSEVWLRNFLRPYISIH